MNHSTVDLDSLLSANDANICMQRLYENVDCYETPLRSVQTLPAPAMCKKYLGIMPSVMTDAKDGDTLYFGAKCLSVFLGEGAPAKTHQGAYLLFDGRSGELLCTMDAAALTALRTAASSAVRLAPFCLLYPKLRRSLCMWVSLAPESKRDGMQ